ncbi:MAG TPA: glycerate kinase [Mobilitalea sp.]|nr:glycerate kinase [Mobilitalea sp.]
MKVVIAIDSLKGSLTSMEAGRAIEKGIFNVNPSAEIIVKPLADGGEGTTEALIEGLGGEKINIEVCGPLREKVNAQYGILTETKTAIIEIAAAAGIILIKEEERNPLKATTYGVGEMIKDAIRRGCRDFIIGIGGSATNDGGIGMLSALGYEFTDASGNRLVFGGGELQRVEHISSSNVIPELKQCNFIVACDVTNPLYGENGATFIYGPQKGVTNDYKVDLDKAMANYATVTKKYVGNDFADALGAGAAGGLGFAFLSYLKADLKSGINLVLDAVKLEDCIKDADYVVTGEGCLDYQTSLGKAPVGIAKMAKKNGAIVIALAGSILEGAESCNANGIDSYFSILNKVITLKEAMKKETAESNMIRTTEQIFRLVNSVEKRQSKS